VIAITMASTEPNTLEAAFIAQARSTAFPEVPPPVSASGALARARNPVGHDEGNTRAGRISVCCY
jgi:hypothetical protein